MLLELMGCLVGGSRKKMNGKELKNAQFHCLIGKPKPEKSFQWKDQFTEVMKLVFHPSSIPLCFCFAQITFISPNKMYLALLLACFSF